MPVVLVDCCCSKTTEESAEHDFIMLDKPIYLPDEDWIRKSRYRYGNRTCGWSHK
jgi:hypothetical protein